MAVAASVCPSCNSDTSAEDAYCQECGHFLCAPAKDENDSTSPYINAAVRHVFADLSPRAAKPVVALPVVAGVLGLLALLPWAIYALEKSYSSLSGRYVTDQAAKAIKESQYDVAIDILARNALIHELKPEQRDLFDRALLERAQINIRANRFPAAATDLGKISSTFSQSVLAKQLLDQCNAHIVSAAKLSRPAAIHLQKLPLRATPRPPAQKEKAAAQTAAKDSPAHSVPAQRSIATVETDPARTAPQDQSPQPPPSTEPEKEKPEPVAVAARKETAFAQKDLARYNELLAGYFSRGMTRKPAAKTIEPPTFKEWVGQGKPSF
ncbi:MAG: hypothetical protein ACRD3W_02565 [Terriglobales bacterium]